MNLILKNFIQGTLRTSLWFSIPFWLLWCALPETGIYSSGTEDVVFAIIFYSFFHLALILWGVAIVIVSRRVRNMAHPGWRRLQIIALAVASVLFLASSNTYYINILGAIFQLPFILVGVHLCFVIPPWVYEGFKNKS
ncbi:hypothetical protein N9F12_02265 [Burkholderiaceae bacterium]|nr:hypothetical protein [Burkholderiaceae bacterium]